jgi:hypothetical protein
MSQTPLGDCTDALELASDLGVADLSSPDNQQPSHDDNMGSEQILSLGISLGDQQPGQTSHTSINMSLQWATLKIYGFKTQFISITSKLR